MALRLISTSVHDLDCRPSRQPSRSRLTVLCCRSRNNLPQPLVWPGNWVHTQARTLAMPRRMPGTDSLMVPIHSSVSSALTIPRPISMSQELRMSQSVPTCLHVRNSEVWERSCRTPTRTVIILDGTAPCPGRFRSIAGRHSCCPQGSTVPRGDRHLVKATSDFLGIDAVGISRCPDWTWYSCEWSRYLML